MLKVEGFSLSWTPDKAVRDNSSSHIHGDPHENAGEGGLRCSSSEAIIPRFWQLEGSQRSASAHRKPSSSSVDLNLCGNQPARLRHWWGEGGHLCEPYLCPPGPGGHSKVRLVSDEWAPMGFLWLKLIDSLWSSVFHFPVLPLRMRITHRA